MTYNDDYQQRQREDDRKREEERRREDERKREEERRREDERKREEERRREDERKRDEERKREETRQAEIKKQADEKAQARKADLERIARQHKDDLAKKSAQLKDDLDARAVREREAFNTAMDRKAALEQADALTQQLSERRRQQEDATYLSTSIGQGILSDASSIAAAVRAMTDVSSGPSSMFLDRNNVARNLSDLSEADIQIISAEIKIQKANNASDITASEPVATPFQDAPKQKPPEIIVRPSILNEKWNRDLQFQSEDGHDVITAIPELKWVTVSSSATSSLNVDKWKYPVKLSDDTVFGISYFSRIKWQIIQKYYYNQLTTVLECQGTTFALKDNVRVILKIYSGVAESEIVDPVVAVQRIPITTDVIALLRHGDLIGFNLRNNRSDGDIPNITEDRLRQLLDNGSIYLFTYRRCRDMDRDTLTLAQKTGEKLGRTVLEYIEKLVDGKDWRHHWEKRFGRPPTQGEAVRALGAEAVILTDGDIRAKERQEKDALWKGLSSLEKVKHIITGRS